MAQQKLLFCCLVAVFGKRNQLPFLIQRMFFALSDYVSIKLKQALLSHKKSSATHCRSNYYLYSTEYDPRVQEV